jgi:hypothetical protein
MSPGAGFQVLKDEEGSTLFDAFRTRESRQAQKNRLAR